MTHPLGTYTFLPWLRHGIANNVASADGTSTVQLRASVPVDLTIQAQGVDGGSPSAVVSKPVQLYGPGDIVGIDARAIVKNEPGHWITNFEPNYLPFVEFYDEDFAWRYTPAAPDTTRERLRPWITLLVLTEDEFEEGGSIASRPLQFVTVADLATAFPRADQLWAWAHVHVNGALADAVVAPDAAMPGVLDGLETLLAQDPDRASCRLLSPRKLAPQQGYHAFVVPTFETGRLAGLGLDPAAAPAPVHATFSAWADYTGRPESGAFPYYHRWFFRTGTLGDFEYLVRLLQPRSMNSRVGQRDFDVQRPGSNIDGITDPELGGILRLGGALRVPQDTLSDDEEVEAQKYEDWDEPYPHEFQKDLAAFVNLADNYVDPDTPPDPDPLITAPLYGRWHALTQRLLTQRDGSDAPNRTNWVHELNLDPRHRIPAGFGTEVVKENQETYMNAAWEQVGEILAANERIRRAQLAKEAAGVWHELVLKKMQSSGHERAFVFTAPVHRSVIADGLTVGYRTQQSALPRAVVSAPLRRMLRPGGPLVNGLGLVGEQAPALLVDRVNEGKITAAPPKMTPPALPTTDALAEHVLPAGVPRFVLDALRRYPWLRFLPLVLALVVLILLLLLWPGPAAIAAGLAVAVGSIALLPQLSRWAKQADAAHVLRPNGQTPEAVDALPKSPDFRITEPEDAFRPRPGATDSREAAKFKAALRETYELVQASARVGTVAPRAPLAVTGVVKATVAALDPQLSIPRRVLDSISLPERIRSQNPEGFREAMAYLEFDLPMYKPLVKLSDEYFLPNLNLIPQNTISLLETNQRFIEAYMVGLNHELGRELLWREFPTDQRGSYFRQFWDVTPFLAAAGTDSAQLRERLRDIPPIHHWPSDSKLGAHDHRERPGGEQEEDLVLVVRGELLKKYPTAVIYAQKAEWQTKTVSGATVIDPSKPRRPVELTPAEEEDPPREKVKTPLYEAQIAPDVYFFGFDLDDEEARGGTGEDLDDEPGWFFVIKERPGEPRFGLDLEGSDTTHFWNDLAWQDVVPGNADGKHIVVGDLPGFTLTPPPAGTTEEDEVRADQHEEDVQVRWNANSNAADLAYVLYQVPVLVGVHAAEMLPKP